MNKSRGFKNIFWGLVSQVITILLGIIIPRLVLVNLGSEANGLLSSIGSVLTYMSLLEAGVGTASLQALYTPISNNDRASINSIMAATNYFYRKTGFIYFSLVMIIATGYTFLVESTLPSYQIFSVVLMSGLSGVINYFFQGKYRILLQAEGKSYIITNIATITTVGTNLFKAVALMAGGNVVVIQSVYFVFNLIQMSIYVFYIKRHYRWLDLSEVPNFNAISQKKAVLVHQISGLIFNNTDVILLTLFTSLKTVSVYSMYAMIFGMVKSVVVTISDGFVYAMGQSYKDRDKFLKLFNVYEVYNMCLIFSVFCISKIIITPFLELYTAGVDDINYIDKYLPWLFVIFYLLHNARVSSSHLITIAQEFENTKWRSVLESVINLTVSLVLTFKYGIYGVLLGTIAALLYRTNDMIIYASKIIKRSPLITYKRWIVNLVLFIVIIILTSHIDPNLDSYIAIVVYGIILCCTIIPIFIIVNSLLEPNTAKYAFSVLKNMISKKIGKRKI